MRETLELETQKNVNLLPPWAGPEGDLRRKYPVHDMEFELGGRQIRLLRPTDIDELIRRAKEEDELPFWAYLWPASIGLALYLLEGKGRFPSASIEQEISVLEIGAGLGLAGIAAAMKGWEVIQTDLVPHSLRFARVNALRNGLDIPGFVGDWRAMGLRAKFDLLLGSDVLYEPTLHPALLQLFKEVLAPHGRVLISDPCRVYALQFMARLEDEGWGVEVEDAPAPPDDDTPVLIYSAVRPAPDKDSPDGREP